MERHKDYFEGILQLRSPIKEVEEFIDYYNEKNDIISAIKKVRNGTDYYFISQKRLISFGNLLKRKFTGVLKLSRSIHTRDNQTCKDVYRISVLFRCYDTKLGKTVLYKGDKCIITKIGKKVNIKNKINGNKFRVSFEDLDL